MLRNGGRKRRSASRTVGRADTLDVEKLCLAWQTSAKFVHQTQGVLSALMSQMRVNPRAGDLGVPEQLLESAEVGPGFQKVRGKTMAQRMG